MRSPASSQVSPSVFVDEQLHGADFALFQGDQGFLKFINDVYPTALRAVGRPHMHSQGARRLAGHALVVTPDAVNAVALAGAFAHPGALQRCAAWHVVGLGDGRTAVGADVAHGLGLAALPLEAVGHVLTTPGQGVVCAAVGAVDVVPHQTLCLIGGVFDVAQPFQ